MKLLPAAGILALAVAAQAWSGPGAPGPAGDRGAHRPSRARAPAPDAPALVLGDGRRLSDECDQLWADLDLSRAGDDDDSVTDDAAPASSSLSQGAAARDFLKTLAGRDDAFYRSQLDYFIISNCDYSGSRLDAVQHYEDDGDGTCVRYSDTPSGYCEKPEDCFWEPVPGDRSGSYEDRGVKFSAEDKALSDTQTDEYLTGFAYLLVPGAVCMAVTLLGCVGFIFCRYCLGRCGGRAPSHLGYTKKQRYTPLAVFFLFTVGILVSASLAYTANDVDVTKGLRGTFDGSASCAKGLGNWAHDSAQPLRFVLASMDGAVARITAELDDSDWIGAGLTGLQARMHSYNALYSGMEGFESLSDDVDASLDALDANIEPMVRDLDSTVDTLQNELVAEQSTIADVLTDVTDMLGELEDVARDSEADIVDARDGVDDTKDLRMAAVLAIFALAVPVVSVGVLGVLCGCVSRKFKCMFSLLHLTWLLGSLVAVIGFVVAGGMMVVAVLFTDVCEFTELVTEDFVPTMGADAGDVMNACFADESLLVALNMTDELDFADELVDQFADVDALDVAAEFEAGTAPIDDIEALVMAVDAQDGVDQLNRLTYLGCSPTQNYTVANISEPWLDNAWRLPPSYNALPGENGTEYITRVTAPAFGCAAGSFEQVYDYAAAIVYMQLNIGHGTEVGADWDYDTAVGRHSDLFQANLTDLQSTLSNISAGVVGDVVDAVELFECTMGCGFVGDCWGEIHEAMCTELLGGLAQVAISIWVLSFCLIPICFSAMIAVKRLKGKTMDMNTVLAFDGPTQYVSTDTGGAKFAWG